MIDTEVYQKDYDYVEDYARRKNLSNTLKALPAVLKIENGLSDKRDATVHFTHCLEAAKMMIGLHFEIDLHEEDILMATAIAHIIPETCKVDDLRALLCDEIGLDARIHQLISMTTRKSIQAEKEQKLYYDAIAADKDATLLKLCDRSVFVSRLHHYSIWQAKEFIYETRKFFFPLCIHTREVYPEYYAAMNILMEKMRSMIDASEILINRFEERESALNLEIIDLKEENARLRSMIKAIKEKQE